MRVEALAGACLAGFTPSIIVETFGLAIYRMSIDQRAMDAIVCTGVVLIFFGRSLWRAHRTTHRTNVGARKLSA
ncbi:hypothetical protein C5688_09000 [Methylocystis sp. MitZ-2018]|nr:hypothetical protein C5688_09000 [Methylocystis sp. MitZ-2018]